MEETSKSGHFYEAPAWAEYVLQASAIAGVVWISVFLLRLVWPGSWNGFQPVFRVDAFLCTAAWLVSTVMLWRQFRLRRWACTLAVVIAWCTPGVIWLFSPLREQTSYGNVLVLMAVTGLLAVLLTAACVAGWKELKEGF